MTPNKTPFLQLWRFNENWRTVTRFTILDVVMMVQAMIALVDKWLVLEAGLFLYVGGDAHWVCSFSAAHCCCCCCFNCCLTIIC